MGDGDPSIARTGSTSKSSQINITGLGLDSSTVDSVGYIQGHTGGMCNVFGPNGVFLTHLCSDLADSGLKCGTPYLKQYWGNHILAMDGFDWDYELCPFNIMVMTTSCMLWCLAAMNTMSCYETLDNDRSKTSKHSRIHSVSSENEPNENFDPWIKWGVRIRPKSWIFAGT